MTQDREEKDSEGKEIIAAKQAVREAVCAVLQHNEEQEARVFDTVTLRQGFSADKPMLYITSVYALGSVAEIRQWGSNVSLHEDDVSLKRLGLNPNGYLSFDLGKPKGGLVDPQIIFDVAEQYRNLIDAGVLTPKPRLDYTLDGSRE